MQITSGFASAIAFMGCLTQGRSLKHRGTHFLQLKTENHGTDPAACLNNQSWCM